MKILNTLLTLGCLGGLVSCYPVAVTPTAPGITKKTVSATSPSTVVKKKVSTTTTTVKKKVSPTANYKPSTVSNTVSETASDMVKKATLPKPEAPKVVKTASKVPGKDGFVFNPYTNNQVDVRGIPSGTKVRDPHDSNPVHIFRVP